MIQKLGKIYKLDQVEFKNGVNYISVQFDKLSDLMLYLYEHLGYAYLIDVFATKLSALENLNKEQSLNCFEVSYLLKNLAEQEQLCVQVKIGEDVKLVSQSSLWSNAYVKEMEIAELFGIEFNFSKQNVLLDSNVSEVDPIAEQKCLVLSPSHFLRKYEVDLVLKLSDDIVEKCTLKRGYSYCGLEKTCENLNVEQILNFSDKFNPLLSPVYNVLLADTVEKFISIEIPERAMGIRMIMLELCRIIDHCFSIAMIAYELDYQKYYKDMLFYIERLNELIRLYCGSVSCTSFTCIGGVRFDLPQGWISLCHDELEQIQSDILEFGSLVNLSASLKSALATGKISAQNAINWGLSGPNLRASGINFDLRKHKPYYFYAEVDFEVPVGQRGEALDRYLVRLEEIHQSIRIINQVLDNMPTGKITSDYFPTLHNLQNEIKKEEINESGLRYLVSNPMIIPNGQIYNSLETSCGEAGIYLRGENKESPSRLKVFSAASNAVAGLPSFLEGYNYREALLIYSSLNIHMKEVER